MGFMMGCIFSNCITALVLTATYLNLTCLFAGMFINLKDYNVILRSIGYASPFRYSIEALLSMFILDDKPYKEDVLEYFDYDVGTTKCLYCMAGFFFMYWIVGWLAIVWQSTRL